MVGKSGPDVDSKARVFLACLSLVLIYLSVKAAIRPGFEVNLGGDGGGYVAAGHRYLTEGDVFDIKRPPLYPLIIAWSGGSGGNTTDDLVDRARVSLGVLQSSLTVIFFIAMFLTLLSHTGSLWYALVSSAVGLFARGVYVYDAFIHPETLAHFLMGGLCLSVYWLRGPRRIAATLCFSFFAAAITMVRPEMLYITLIGTILVAVTQLISWRSALLIAIGISLVPTYYAWRNSIEFGFSSYSINGGSIFIHAMDVHRWRLEVSPWKTQNIQFVLDLFEQDPTPDGTKAIDYYPVRLAARGSDRTEVFRPFQRAFWESLPQSLVIKPWVFAIDLFELFRYAYSMRDKYTDPSIGGVGRSAFYLFGLFQTAVQLVSGFASVLIGPVVFFSLWKGWCEFRETRIYLGIWGILVCQVSAVVLLSTSIFPNIRHRQVLHGALIFLASLAIFEVYCRFRDLRTSRLTAS